MAAQQQDQQEETVTVKIFETISDRMAFAALTGREEALPSDEDVEEALGDRESFTREEMKGWMQLGIAAARGKIRASERAAKKDGDLYVAMQAVDDAKERIERILTMAFEDVQNMLEETVE